MITVAFGSCGHACHAQLKLGHARQRHTSYTVALDLGRTVCFCLHVSPHVPNARAVMKLLLPASDRSEGIVKTLNSSDSPRAQQWLPNIRLIIKFSASVGYKLAAQVWIAPRERKIRTACFRLSQNTKYSTQFTLSKAAALRLCAYSLCTLLASWHEAGIGSNVRFGRIFNHTS